MASGCPEFAIIRRHDFRDRPFFCPNCRNRCFGGRVTLGKTKRVLAARHVFRPDFAAFRPPKELRSSCLFFLKYPAALDLGKMKPRIHPEASMSQSKHSDLVTVR